RSDRVDGLAPRVDSEDRLEDPAVRRTIEVLRLQCLDDTRDRLAREHHRAEDRLFRLHVVRWDAVGARACQIFGDGCHIPLPERRSTLSGPPWGLPEEHPWDDVWIALGPARTPRQISSPLFSNDTRTIVATQTDTPRPAAMWLLGHDLHREGRAHVRVQPDRDRMAPDASDRFVEVHLAAVERPARARRQLPRNVDGRDTAEEPHVAPRLGAH